MNKITIGAIALLLIVVGTQHVSAQTTSPEIAVVGDSLIVQAHSHYPLPAVVQAHSGYSTQNLGDWGTFNKPDVLVTALGTNDMRLVNGKVFSTWDQARANLKAHLARNGAGCNVLVGIVTTPYRGLNRYGPGYNGLLKNLVSTGYADVFVDWNAIVLQHPEHLIWDQTHHTLAGQEAYRQAIVTGISQC